jgi:hypothetical protein
MITRKLNFKTMGIKTAHLALIQSDFPANVKQEFSRYPTEWRKNLSPPSRPSRLCGENPQLTPLTSMDFPTTDSRI